MKPQIISNGSSNLPAVVSDMPKAIIELGAPGAHAWHDFFSGSIPNPNTRIAYARAVRNFFDWCQCQNLDVARLTPGNVGDYFREHHKGSPSSKKQHLSGLRMFYALLVERHLVILNPTLGVRLERESFEEGKTAMLQPKEVKRLLQSIDTGPLVGIRDYAIIATLIGTAARAGGVAGLKVGNFKHDGTQYILRFREKGGKIIPIPVRHDLEAILLDYIERSGLADAPPRSPLFRTAVARKNRFTETGMTGFDVYRMFKRRCLRAGLPGDRTPHSTRTLVATDLLDQDVPLEHVQRLLGHSDPRTTLIYDRRRRAVTRNVVERISPSLAQEG